MTLQTSGAISINNINTELGVASGTARGLGDASSRNLAGVASGAISLSNFYGKSNVQELIFDNSAAFWGNPQDWNLWNIFLFSGVSITSNKVKVIFRNIVITSSTISVPALQTGTGWPSGTQLEVVIESTAAIYGRRGAGGAAMTVGGAGGRAVAITEAITSGSIKITNQGAIHAGGGGGGGGGTGYVYVGGDADNCNANSGGVGGNGAGSTGTAGAVAAATSGTKPTVYGGRGGAGGTYGAAGATGDSGTQPTSKCTPQAGKAGGAGGAAIINSSLATISNTGTITGALA